MLDDVVTRGQIFIVPLERRVANHAKRDARKRHSNTARSLIVLNVGTFYFFDFVARAATIEIYRCRAYSDVRERVGIRICRAYEE